MKSEAEILERIKKVHADLAKANELFHKAIDGPRKQFRNADEDPDMLSSVITQCESELYSLRWMLGGTHEECLREAEVIE